MFVNIFYVVLFIRINKHINRNECNNYLQVPSKPCYQFTCWNFFCLHIIFRSGSFCRYYSQNDRVHINFYIYFRCDNERSFDLNRTLCLGSFSFIFKNILNIRILDFLSKYEKKNEISSNDAFKM